MKLVIAGGRDFVPTARDWDRLDSVRITQAWKGNPIIEVISGKARGADTFGEEWARRRGIAVAEYPADWDHYGKAAGHIRNNMMAQRADAVLLFPGGSGTANMFQQAVRYGLTIFDWR